MKKTMLATALLACASVAIAGEISVSSVSISQDPRTRLVTVEYTLGDEPAIVTVDFQTNGVSIGEANFTNVIGDVNRLVSTPGRHVITWRPDKSPLASVSFAGIPVTAEVKAWPKDDPPDYMVALLGENDISMPRITYYVSTNALPGGLENDEYRTTKLVMRRIHAAGVRWLMGNDGSEVAASANETPHYVTLSEDYYIGIFETTQEQHRQFSGYGYTDGKDNPDYATNRSDIAVSPKVKIEWRYLRGNDAPINRYRTLGTSRSDIKALRDRTGVDFDLPTEAQWEYAARAGATNGVMFAGIIYNNAASVQQYEWYYGNSDMHTEAKGYPGGDGIQHGHRVGSKLPNPFGLYDMLGNADEMCLDAYVTDLGTAEVTDPINSVPESSSSRVRRGVNINGSIANLRGTIRSKLTASSSSDYKIGYRLSCPVALKYPAEAAE